MWGRSEDVALGGSSGSPGLAKARSNTGDDAAEHLVCSSQSWEEGCALLPLSLLLSWKVLGEIESCL